MHRQELPPLIYPQLHVTSYTLCVLLCVTSLVQCSDITFSSSTSTIKPLVTDSLALRCGVKDGVPTGTSGIIGKRDIISTDHGHSRSRSFNQGSSSISKRNSKTSDIVFVSSILLTKNNQDIATVTEHSVAKVFNNTVNVHVTGNVTANGAERGFLQVTWDYPDSSLSGNYQCVVTGYDIDDHPYMLTETVDVDNNEVTLNDIASYIHQLKLDNEQQKQVNGQLITDISHMKAEISALQTSNADLKTKADTKVLFTAHLSKSVTVSSGNVLVFDKLLTSLGGGYSTTTGIFTAPVSGYFMFELHVLGQPGKLAIFNLLHNNNRVAWVRIEDGLDYQGGSNSAALLLQKGDEVKLAAANTAYPYGESISATTFSGYLIDLE